MPKVLIAEDDLMIAEFVRQILLDGGYEICGVARTVAEAVALGRRHKPDLAIIDLQLAEGGLGFEIPAQLDTLHDLGVLYASGSFGQVWLSANDGQACLAKPFRPRDLLRGLELVAALVATGEASPPFPLGFFVLDSQPSRAEQDHSELKGLETT